METERQSRQPRAAWPFDLRVFAAVAGLWALCLAIRAFVHVGDFEVVDPIETIFAGMRFNGNAARVVLIVEAGIFAAMAIGVFARRRWGLLLALCYMVQVVMSHLAFAIAYLPIRSEWVNVRVVASEGPMMVLITLYLWIRACDLIFDSLPIPTDARARQSSDANHRAAVRADSGAGDVAAMAD
ncbi:hypothetical protein [Candidatus Binatus sp.]|uniref:hypothetical protein n=1 Tax=Candidatus Binatus sp. TaxID=2811406 RepID=UPI002F950BE7